MIIYVDTGVFFDYLIYRSLTGARMRGASRRGRARSRLSKDATSCFSEIQKKSHKGITSTLTLFELEHAVFEDLQASTKGVSYKDKYIIPSARATVLQGFATIQTYGIVLLDLTPTVITRMLEESHLQISGIHAADSLHVVTAILNNAELIITTDTDLRRLDGVFINSAGTKIRCVDTDVALSLL